MANVKFLMGTQASLPTAANSIAGAFYVTSDTHRLYVSQEVGGTKTLNLLSQAVVCYDSDSSLPSSGVEGQFYYLKDQNVLAIYKNNAYVQINPDHYVASTDLKVSAVTGGAQLGAYTKDNNNDVLTDSSVTGAKIVGSGAVSVSVDSTDDHKVIVKGKEFTIGDSALTAQGLKTWSLKADGTAISGSDIKLQAGSNIEFSEDGGVLTIIGAAAGDIAALGNDALSIDDNDTNGYDITIEDLSGASSTITLDPAIKIGNDNATNKAAAAGNFKIKDGIVELPVYTMAQIDSLFKGANAMTYRGPVSALPASDIHIGDTYRLTANIASLGADAGDLIVAVAKTGKSEGSDGTIAAADVDWEVVESGDDTDTRVEMTALSGSVGFSLDEANGAEASIGDVQFLAGNNLGVAQDTNTAGVIKVTYSHDQLSAAAAGSADSTGNKTVKGDNKVFTAVTGLTVDAAGHVSGWKTSNFDVTDTTLDANGSSASFAAAVASNVATATLSLDIKDTDGNDVDKDASFSLTSNTLTLSASGSAITADLVWGSF